MIINRVFFLCIIVCVVFVYEFGCLMGFVGVGVCLYLNNKCSIGFCY